MITFIKNKLQDISWPLFVTLFFCFTWIMWSNGIVAFDLWWHLASGKYTIVNGEFPPLATFSQGILSDVSSHHDFVSRSVLGDIVLYWIYNISGSIGLQFFRILVILSCCLPILYAANWRKNIYTLTLCVLCTVGLSQLLLIKNAIFAILFLSFYALIILHYYKNKSVLLLYSFIPINIIWAYSHGSVLLGIFTLILVTIGLSIDNILEKKTKRNYVHFIIILCVSYYSVNQIWEIHLVSRLTQAISSKPNVTKSSSQNNQKIQTKQIHKKKDFQIKDIFRVLFKSGSDETIIAEYASPLDAQKSPVFWTLMGVLLIFIISLFYHHYFKSFFGLTLPALFLTFIGFGYLRTSAFPFCFSLACFVFLITNSNKNFFSDKVKKFSSIACLILLLAYFLFTAIFFIKRTPYTITGFFGNEPQLGNSLFFNKNMPEWVLRNLKEEKVYNSYAYGGYLIWEWYSKRKVLMDGRSILYDRNYFKQYLNKSGINYCKHNNINYALIHISTYRDYQTYFNDGWLPVQIDTSSVLFKKVDSTTKAFHPNFLFEYNKLNLHDINIRKMMGAVSYLSLYHMLKLGWAETAGKWMEAYPQLTQPLINESDFISNNEILSKLLNHLKESIGLENSPIVKEFFHHFVISKDKKNRELSLKSVMFYSGKLKPTPNELFELEKFQPKNRKVLATLGHYFMGIKDYPNAIKRYEQYISHHTDKAEIYYQLAKCQHLLKNYVKAHQALDESLIIVKEPISVYFFKAILFYEQKDFKKTNEMLNKVFAINPNYKEGLRMKKAIAPYLNKTN